MRLADSVSVRLFRESPLCSSLDEKLLSLFLLWIFVRQAGLTLFFFKFFPVSFLSSKFSFPWFHLDSSWFRSELKVLTKTFLLAEHPCHLQKLKNFKLTIKFQSLISEVSASESLDVEVNTSQRLPSIVTSGVAFPFDVNFYRLVRDWAVRLLGDSVVDNFLKRVFGLFLRLFSH